MKKVLCTVAIVAIIAACGGGGGGSSSTSTTTTTTTSTATGTTTDNASAGTGAVSAGTGTTTTFQNISKISVTGAGQAPKFKSISVSSGNEGLDKVNLLTGRMGDSPLMKAAVEKAYMAAKTGAKATASASCTDGGSFTGSASSSTSFSVTFSNCKEGGNMYNGTVSMSIGTATTAGTPITMTMGTSTSKFAITSFSGTYDIAVLKMEMAMTMVNTYSASTSSTSGATYDMVANGTMNLTDYSTTNTYALTFTSFQTKAVATSTTISTTLNGKFEESWTEAGVASTISLTYTTFKVDITDDGTYTQVSPSGTVSITYTPSTTCSVSSVTIVTVTPIKYVNASGKTIAGQLTLNSTTTVTFNSDGTVSVSDGTTTTSYASSYAMSKECPFAVPNPDTSAPPATASTTTTGVSATTMTVTSVSKAGAAGSLACYTDLHVNYYNVVAPTSTTAGTWKVDWHNNLPCTNPSTFTFEEAQDTDADGICDVGLDINGGSQDSTSGGLEHFTALKLPSGYYVISMNNYSCANDTTNEVTIQLGSNVYGPYAASYTSSGEGTTLGAWARVRDVRVNADKTVDVLSPNTALNPWHTGTFGIAAPKYSSKR